MHLIKNICQQQSSLDLCLICIPRFDSCPVQKKTFLMMFFLPTKIILYSVNYSTSTYIKQWSHFTCMNLPTSVTTFLKIYSSLLTSNHPNLVILANSWKEKTRITHSIKHDCLQLGYLAVSKYVLCVHECTQVCLCMHVCMCVYACVRMCVWVCVLTT